MQLASLNAFTKRGERFLLETENLRQVGVKVAGVYCTFAPLELIRAAGAVPVGLCGKRQDPIAAAEAVLPANLCPLIKSSYGYAITDTCPFFAASDVLVGETTCDGKKKMFELLGRLKPMHVMQMPHGIGPDQLAYWELALQRLRAFLEEHTGQAVTEEGLRREIRLQNRTRELLKQIAASSAAERPILSGVQMMTVMESRGFVVDQEAYLAELERLRDELSAAAAQADAPALDAPRVLLTGCPVGKGSDKVLRIIEECGGLVVAQENCTSLKPLDLLVEETGDPWRALAWRYLNTPCSCLSPNQGRFDLIGRLITQYRVQGVVDLTWHCCHAYNVESALLREYLQERPGGLPLLHIETDYSEGDSGQLHTRVEAFLEMLR